MNNNYLVNEILYQMKIGYISLIIKHTVMPYPSLYQVHPHSENDYFFNVNVN